MEVVERDEERAYAFVTGGKEMDLALWRYELQPDGDGTVLVEQWTLRKPSFFLDQAATPRSPVGRPTPRRASPPPCRA